LAFGDAKPIITIGDESYIPSTLEDSIQHLDKLLEKDTIEKIQSASEDEINQFHMGLGMWMRNNWGLWKGSDLAKWFNTKGITHADDMSGIIITSYWRHLHNKPIDLDSQINSYKEFWLKTIGKESPE